MNEAIEKIESQYRFQTGNNPHPDFAKIILSELESLQPKFSEDLEKAITELACKLTFSGTPLVDAVVDVAEGIICDFLSANRLVQMVDQSLPKLVSVEGCATAAEKCGFVEGVKAAQEIMLKPDKDGCVWRKVKELK